MLTCRKRGRSGGLSLSRQGDGLWCCARRSHHRIGRSDPSARCTDAPSYIQGYLALINNRQAEYVLNGKVLDISLRPHEVDSLLPRELLGQLQPLEPTLLDRVSTSAEDRMQANFRRIALRTLVCALLTIPVLVFIWSSLETDTMEYTTVSFVLSTITSGMGYPL